MLTLLSINLVLVVLAVVLLLVLLMKKPEAAFTDRVRMEVDRLSVALREESRLDRDEGAVSGRQLREEMMTGIRALGESLTTQITGDGKQQLDHLQTFSTALTDSSERGEQRLAEMRGTLDERLLAAAEGQRTSSAEVRGGVQVALTELRESSSMQIEALRTNLDQRLAKADEAAQFGDTQTRQELQTALKSFSELLAKQLQDLAHVLKQQLSDLTATNEAKLEHIRVTVDEKLHQTLEQRLGESFRLVSERLEQVHTGLGEMKSLAVGVGDLKKVLTNIKTRGTWGEVQLGTLLEQMLTVDQFARNVAPTPRSTERVEFAVKLPGRDHDGTPVWLPIDSKFPQEEFQRLGEAQERGDAEGIEAAFRAVEVQVKAEARKIREKYLHPPNTTDFGIMFLPTEGLFAEVLRRPGLAESIQRDFRVVISGPTTLAALLSSLQMGFRTLAIEKRSSEVWNVLGAVKTEFGKFGEALEKVKKKLSEASSSIDAAETRHRVVAGKLRKAEELPAAEAAQILSLDGVLDEVPAIAVPPTES